MCNKIVWSFLFMLLVSWVTLSDIQAPEITAREVYGYDTCETPEDGAICDRDCTDSGKIHGDTVYEAQWNEKYYIHGNRVYRVELEG
jgi:hypothetical protein